MPSHQGLRLARETVGGVVMTTYGLLMPNSTPCTCADGICNKHDALTPAEDLYAMVDVLRGKLLPELTWKYTDPEGYYL